MFLPENSENSENLENSEFINEMANDNVVENIVNMLEPLIAYIKKIINL